MIDYNREIFQEIIILCNLLKLLLVPAEIPLNEL